MSAPARPALLLFLATVILLAGCAGAPRQRPLSAAEIAALAPQSNPVVPLDEIVALSRAGTASEAIIKKLQDTGTVHNLSPKQIVDLHTQGVSQTVLDYLGATQEKARQAAQARQIAERDLQYERLLDQQRRMLDPYFYGGYGAGPWGPFGPYPRFFGGPQFRGNWPYPW
jgi:hypothetical protein